MAATEPIHIIGFEPHMHRIGKHMKTAVKHKDGTLETIFDARLRNVLPVRVFLAGPRARERRAEPARCDRHLLVERRGGPQPRWGASRRGIERPCVQRPVRVQRTVAASA
jgi:hypothetical protein